MNTSLERLRFLIVGFYAWITTAFFGGVFLDIVYANLLQDSPGTFSNATMFSIVSDVLLCIGVVIIFAAIGAITLSWKSAVVRNLFLASLVIFSFEFLVPVFFSLFFKSTQELPICPWIRLIPSGMASIFANIGLYKYYRQYD